MNEKKYNAPECGIVELAAGSLLCASDKANGDKYGDGSDFSGKDKWEGMVW